MAPKNRNPATKQETPLIESKSKNDDDDSKNIWSGTAFGRYQLLWYILSSMGLSYYFCHWFLGYDSKVRVFNHALAEVVILLGRWVNEYIYSKFGVEDILHHVVMIVGTGIVLFGPDVYKDRGYLVCHMEILHIPMMIWYLGCRRGALLESYPSAVSLSRTLFRPIWIFASIYRCTLMLGAAILAIKQSDAGAYCSQLSSLPLRLSSPT